MIVGQRQRLQLLMMLLLVQMQMMVLVHRRRQRRHDGRLVVAGTQQQQLRRWRLRCGRRRRRRVNRQARGEQAMVALRPGQVGRWWRCGRCGRRRQQRRAVHHFGRRVAHVGGSVCGPDAGGRCGNGGKGGGRLADGNAAADARTEFDWLAVNVRRRWCADLGFGAEAEAQTAGGRRRTGPVRLMVGLVMVVLMM